MQVRFRPLFCVPLGLAIAEFSTNSLAIAVVLLDERKSLVSAQFAELHNEGDFMVGWHRSPDAVPSAA